MPALTAPFVLTTWLLLFAVYQFDFLQPDRADRPTHARTGGRRPDRAAGAGHRHRRPDPGQPGPQLFRGVGEVMFEDNLLTGVIFLIAILVNSRISALFAALGRRWRC